MIRDKIKNSLTEAMKSRDNAKVQALRLVMASIKDKDIVSRSSGSVEGISDQDIINLLQAMIKQCRDNVRSYSQAGREDLANKESYEAEVIQSFLPEQMSDEELDEVVGDIIRENNFSSLKDIAAVIDIVKDQYPGKVENSRVSKVVKQKLS